MENYIEQNNNDWCKAADMEALTSARNQGKRQKFPREMNPKQLRSYMAFMWQQIFGRSAVFCNAVADGTMDISLFMDIMAPIAEKMEKIYKDFHATCDGLKITITRKD